MSHIDVMRLALLNNSGLNGDPTHCLASHALAPGIHESTVEKQHVTALAYWQAHNVNSLTADAITYLTANLARLRNPSSAMAVPDR